MMVTRDQVRYVQNLCIVSVLCISPRATDLSGRDTYDREGLAIERRQCNGECALTMRQSALDLPCKACPCP